MLIFDNFFEYELSLYVKLCYNLKMDKCENDELAP